MPWFIIFLENIFRQKYIFIYEIYVGLKIMLNQFNTLHVFKKLNAPEVFAVMVTWLLKYVLYLFSR